VVKSIDFLYMNTEAQLRGSETLSGVYQFKICDTYIYLLSTCSRCSIGINTFELGRYFTVSDRLIGSPLIAFHVDYFSIEDVELSAC